MKNERIAQAIEHVASLVAEEGMQRGYTAARCAALHDRVVNRMTRNTDCLVSGIGYWNRTMNADLMGLISQGKI